MQALVPTGGRNPNDHTETEILAALRGSTGARRLSFRYELYDSARTLVEDLTGVRACTVDMAWHADVKRTAKLVVDDDGVINYLSDLIKPYVRLHLPPWGADDFVEWPQGLFLPTSPVRTVDGSGRRLRSVTAYDQLLILKQDRVTARYTVDGGTVVTTAVAALLTDFDVTMTVSASTLPVAKEWDPGTPKLKIVNELLGMINYQSLSFDEDGRAVVAPYVAPSDRPAEYTYADDAASVLRPDVGQELDLADVANRWTLVVSEPDRPALTSTYTNTDPSSPTSTVSRGRTIVDFRDQQEAATQADLDARVARLAFEASQVYEELTFDTAIMPMHSGNDVVHVTFAPFAINTKYAETGWTMPLKAGARMRHRARRVVTV